MQSVVLFLQNKGNYYIYDIQVRYIHIAVYNVGLKTMNQQCES
jgi:hypothetical protein